MAHGRLSCWCPGAVCLSLAMVLWAVRTRTPMLERGACSRRSSWPCNAKHPVDAGIARGKALLTADSAFRGENWQLDGTQLGGPGTATVAIRIAEQAGEPQVYQLKAVATLLARGTQMHDARRAASSNQLRRATMNARVSRAFTLVELLVVIAIIGVFVATMIPAVQAKPRNRSWWHLCESNLSRLVLALHAYDNSFEMLPAGVVNPDGRSEAVGLHQGWLIHTLPYLDEQNAVRSVDFAKSVYDPANAAGARALAERVYLPVGGRGRARCLNYAGCHNDVEAPIADDNHGVLFLNSHIRREDISDGLGYSLFIAEEARQSGRSGLDVGQAGHALSNTGLPPNHVVPLPETPMAEARPLTYVGPFASHHPGGLN